VTNPRHPSEINPSIIVVQTVYDCWSPRPCSNSRKFLRSSFFAQVFCWGLSSCPNRVFSVAVLVTAAVISVGSCFSTVGEATAASGKKIAVVLEPSAGPRASATHVYLMRGFLNVFSLGMDTLAAELRSVGVSATVGSYFNWHEAAHAIAANYKAGQHGPIVLVGHSFGADSVMHMGTDLGQEGVPVALIVAFRCGVQVGHKMTA
jgi:pimeloyl-ACP methyl ester carboxylesterase